MVVRQGNSVACWNIMPISRRGPVTGRPSSMTLPDEGGVSPAMIFRSVDLPQPDGPMMELKVPRSRVRSTWSRARMAPRPNALETLRSA